MTIGAQTRRWHRHGRWGAVVCGLCVVITACGRDAPEQGPIPITAAEETTLADFKKRVDDYVSIHKAIESELPSLPNEASPAQIDTRQRELLKRLAAARADSKQGDIFSSDMQKLIRDHFLPIFDSRDGQDVRGSIMDENPVGIDIVVNQRYPDDVPLSTMPPEVLQALPKMPEELEYRFVGRHLVIVDAHAHLIADYLPNAIPQ